MLDLNDLGAGQNPAITAAIGNALAEAGAVCLAANRHQPGVPLVIRGRADRRYRLVWPLPPTQAALGWNDPAEAVEEGAAGIAVLLANREIGSLVIVRSWKGTGFDYLLGDTDTRNMSEAERSVRSEWAKLLEDASLVPRGRLEVSGILNGSDSQIRARVNEKLEQTNRSDHWGIPAFVIVVEFGRPLAEVREK